MTDRAIYSQIYYRGNIAYDRNDLPQAQSYYEHACRGHVSEQEFHPAHICANYKLACTEIKLGKILRAMSVHRFPPLTSVIFYPLI